MHGKYKILIIGPAWVGDMVMSQTLFKLLQQQYAGQLELDVFANNWASGLLSRMPEVNQVIVNPFMHGKLNLLPRIKLGYKLRTKHYNQVFVLPNSFKSAIVPFFAKIRKRTGFVGESRYGLLNEVFKLNSKQLPLMIDRFCALANHGNKLPKLAWPNLTIDAINQKQLISRFGLSLNSNLIAFCPAAEYGPAKRWPPAYFANLADLLSELGYKVIILGSQKDCAISNEIISLAKTPHAIIDVCGKTNLTDAIDLLALAKYVITNDSGLMHIACAVGSKVIAIYGSSSPNFTPPLALTAEIIKVQLDCSPCFQRTCKFNHYNCLKFITPEMVLAKLKLSKLA